MSNAKHSDNLDYWCLKEKHRKYGENWRACISNFINLAKKAYQSNKLAYLNTILNFNLAGMW
jgi:hypothetical protein